MSDRKPASRLEQEGRAVARSEGQSTGDEPDVLLDVPQLKVDEIGLEVEGLEAHVSLSAGVGDLVHLAVGADVTLGKVKLDIKGVEVQALLKVRLEKVLAILDRALATVDRHPEILRSLASTVDRTGGLARQALGEGGAVGDAASLSGDTARRVVGEGGAASQAAEAAGQAAQETEGVIEAEGKVEATDAAKRKAEQLGVDLASVRGTGSGGRITAGDAAKAAVEE